MPILALWVLWPYSTPMSILALWVQGPFWRAFGGWKQPKFKSKGIVGHDVRLQTSPGQVVEKDVDDKKVRRSSTDGFACGFRV